MWPHLIQITGNSHLQPHDEHEVLPVPVLPETHFAMVLVSGGFTTAFLDLSSPFDLITVDGFQLFKVDATGAYSQRICRSLGLEEVKRVSYTEYCDENGVPVFQVPPPHQALCIMILQIP